MTESARPSRGWMPLSPEQIRQRTFHDNQLGRRGYRRDEVDAFVTRLAGEVQRWSQAYAHADAEIQRLRNYFKDQGIDAEGAGPQQRDADPAAPSADAVNVLAQAQAHADQLIANAQAHARAMQYDAREHAEAIVSHARQEADKAAHAYRAQAGESYTAEREQVERLATLGRSILAALNGATTQLDGASASMRAISEAFNNELTKVTSSPPPLRVPEI